jgi:hypothetical protein
MTWTVARDGAQLEVASFQRRDAGVEMVICDRVADAELVEPCRHVLRIVPSPCQVSLTTSADPYRLSGQRNGRIDLQL